MSACIYLIHSNLSPEKFYVGSAVIFSKRWKKHKQDLQKQKHHCKYLQRCFNKNPNFQFYILEYVKDLSKLLDREDYYLQDYFGFDEELYNECFVAGSKLFIKCSEKTKRKMSDSQRGENNHFYNKHHTEKSKNKISKAQIGNLKRAKEWILTLPNGINKKILGLENTCKEYNLTSTAVTYLKKYGKFKGFKAERI